MIDILQEINDLKRRENATILAHYYQEGEIQEIADFTGVSAPYEEPETPEIRIDTTGVSPSESAQVVLDRLAQLEVVHA